MMIIRKIRMINFRGFIDKTFCFDDKAVVLVSAANGIGKTTMVDAIEWCLTGNIGRLKSAFISRSPNDSERKINMDGILKNSKAGEKDKVVVIIWLFDGKKEIVLQREQIKDELDEEASIVTIDNDIEKAKKFCSNYVDESFYNFHFCDVQKSFNIQSKKRKDMKELFGEFITNYDDQKKTAENLEIFAEDVDRYITDKINQKVAQDDIDSLEKQVTKTCEEAKNIPYPEVAFYTDEKLDITVLNGDELNTQMQCLTSCAYKVVEEKLCKLLANDDLKLKRNSLKKIESYWKSTGNSIKKALDAGLFYDTNAITVVDTKLRKVEALSLSKDTIIQDSEILIALRIDGFSKDDFVADKELIKDIDKRIEDIKKDIELLSQNNIILKLLSKLSACKQEVLNYRNEQLEKNGIVKCPICGSESFAKLDDSSILKEADAYIKLNGEGVKQKEKEKKRLQDEKDKLLNKIISRAKTAVEKECGVLKAKILELKALKEEVHPYYEEVKKYQVIDNSIAIDELTAEKVRNLLELAGNDVLKDSEEKMLRDEYQHILSVVGYGYENEMIRQTYEKVKNLATNSYDISNFTYDSFVSKINAINSIISNHKLAELNKRLDEYRNKNIKIDEEIEELDKLKNTASNRAKEIREIIEQLSKDEYEQVGPAIGNFYNKLSRFNYRDGIRIVQKNEGLSLVDNNDKNIVNVLSNGQISVFMLAHFFAGINARNGREKMKVYFIDDLTACMDDVNMLAFMDLLKYQMSSKATMEQLFFVTCDDRISKLFRYKMYGHGIDLCEFKEADFMQG